MKNLPLAVGRCAVCQERISPSWVSAPQLGSKCQKHNELDIFTIDHFQLAYSRQLMFNPLRGLCFYAMNWRGTRLLIDKKVRTITDQEEQWSWIQTEGHNAEQQVYGLTNDTLRKLYVEMGTSLQPWAVSYQYHPVRLEPSGRITLVTSETDPETKLPSSIQVQFDCEPPACYALLHELCDVYVAWLYRLDFNEQLGRLTGHGFHIDSSPRNGRIDFRPLPAEVSTRQTVVEIASLWAQLMQLLLQHPWQQYQLDTMRGWWDVFCRAQDLLLNQFSRKHLQEFVAFARRAKLGKPQHFPVKDMPLRRVFLAGTTTGTTWRTSVTQRLLGSGVGVGQIENPHLPPGVPYTHEHMRQEHAAKRDDNTFVLIVVQVAEPEKGQPAKSEHNRELLGPVSMEEIGQLGFGASHRTAIAIDPSGFTSGRRPRKILEGFVEMLADYFDGGPPYFETRDAATNWLSGKLLERQ